MRKMSERRIVHFKGDYFLWKQQLLEKLKEGDYFKLINRKGEMSKTIYVYEGYSRTNKKYGFVKFVDICDDRYVKKGTLVTTDFIF